MYSVRRDGARWTAGVMCWLALLALPAAAHASLSWSPAIAVDTHAAGTALDGVACPATSQCTAIDGHGREITFNPQSPAGATGSVVGSSALTGIACPGATQCTAVDIQGQQITFNPQSPGAPTPTSIDSAGRLLSVACPLATQCTAVDASGGEVTFDPQSPGTPSVIRIDPGSTNVLAGVSCPDPTECSAVDTGGQEVTFNPQSGQLSRLAPVGASSSPVAISCPTDQCVVVDSGGGAETFGPNGSSSATIDGSVALTSVSCFAVTSGTECAAVDLHGNEVASVVIALGSSSSILAANPVGIDGDGIPTGVSCPAANQCTAVDTSGNAVTFNPGSPASATPVAIDGTTTLTDLACPTETQCTAVDVHGVAVTFAPGSTAAPRLGAIDTQAAGVYGVACPETTQCTAVDIGGGEVTFDPNAPGAPVPVSVDPGRSLYGVACPAATQCTAVDDLGDEVTFNPASPGARTAKAIESGLGLSAVACPTPTQCTAVDVAGDEVTFDPESPGTPKIVRIDANPAVSITCPTATECSAIDAAGREVQFNPSSPHTASRTTLDRTGQLDAIACRTATDCVAVDSIGQAFEGDPGGTARWSVNQITGGSPVAAVACPSARECVAVDTGGLQSVGSSGPLPPVPRRISRPKIAGTPRAGRVLRESHGRWSGGVTSFRYQWQRCNTAGRACASIRGATARTYRLAARDAGHRIRVLESAFDITGAGPPATSAATKMVRPSVPVTATRVSLAGVAERRPKLAFTVTAGPGEPPVKTIVVRLAPFLDVSNGVSALQHVIVVDSRGRKIASPVAVRGRTLTLKLRKSSKRVRVTIGPSVIATSRAVARRARSRKLTSVRMQIVVTETRGAATRLRPKLPVS